MGSGKILADVVWVIRKFQPDIVINRFPTTGEGGHGHHTASAILANDAYAAAADPGRFPEQLAFVSTWQVKRVLWNGFNFGPAVNRDDQFKIDVGGYNPLLGRSYGEMAAESRSQHKSQGFGVAATRGEALEYFKATKGDQPVNDLMDAVETSWKRVTGSEKVSRMIDAAIATFDFIHPEKSVPALVQIYSTLKNSSNSYWQQKKLDEVKNIIQQCAGLFADATTAVHWVAPMDSLRVNFSFNNRLGNNIILKKVKLAGGTAVDTVLNTTLLANKNLNFSKSFFVHPATKQTQPYWLQHPMKEGAFTITDQTMIGQPDVDASIFLIADLEIEGENFQLARPVRFKMTDPVRGELYQPLVVLPATEINFEKDNYFSINDSPVVMTVRVKNNSKATGDYQVTVNHSENWTSSAPALTATNATLKTGVSTVVIKPKRKAINQKDTVSIGIQQGDYRSQPGVKRTINYDHIPAITYLKPAITNLVQLDLKIYNKKVGYITGAGDKVPEALESMGYDVTLLGEKELGKLNLSQFDAILTGVRAYNTQEWLNNYHDKLMKYVSDGGNLLVQYNTSNQIGPVRAKIGPYPFEITRTRVSDERAEVRVLKPLHPVFNFPNKLTAADFNGWIQERSIYHAKDSTQNFEKLLSMNDPGEKPDSGSLLVARFGKGWFTYTGISFFRELPAGVPGAYRLLANLIALNRKKGF